MDARGVELLLVRVVVAEHVPVSARARLLLEVCQQRAVPLRLIALQHVLEPLVHLVRVRFGVRTLT